MLTLRGTESSFVMLQKCMATWGKPSVCRPKVHTKLTTWLCIFSLAYYFLFVLPKCIASGWKRWGLSLPSWQQYFCLCPEVLTHPRLLPEQILDQVRTVFQHDTYINSLSSSIGVGYSLPGAGGDSMTQTAVCRFGDTPIWSWNSVSHWPYYWSLRLLRQCQRNIGDY